MVLGLEASQLMKVKFSILNDLASCDGSFFTP